MSYYKVCPCCGCYLDPGEVCDCKENAVASAANTDNGGQKEEKTDPSFRSL